MFIYFTFQMRQKSVLKQNAKKNGGERKWEVNMKGVVGEVIHI